MGLDMYLYKIEKDKQAYWRKSNQIHNWFVQNTEKVREDIQYTVSTHHLKALRAVCEDVLNKKDIDYAQEHLPPVDGFFFGSTNIDEWYWQDLEETISQLDATISSADEYDEFEYYASW